jgi:hypothetical protein
VGEALEHEEPDEPSLVDVERWMTIYSDLIVFTREMLDRTNRFRATVPSPAQRHLGSTNIRIMEEELAAFGERLALWQERARRLGRAVADQSTGGSLDPNTSPQ